MAGAMCSVAGTIRRAMFEVYDLSFHRDEEPIIDGLSLSVEDGEVLMIRGGNGSGKTTVLKLIAGLLPQGDRKARMRFDGADTDPSDPAFQREVMYLGHQLGIKLDLTSLENQRFFADFLGDDGTDAARNALARVGLTGYAHSLARRMSAGQKKRLALARLCLNRRRLWLLDEPYSNLDQQGLELVDSLLRDHVARGGAAIMTSHGTFVPQVPTLREIML